MTLGSPSCGTSNPGFPGLPSLPGADARGTLSIPRQGDAARVPMAYSAWALVGRGRPSEMRSEALEDVQLSFN